MSTLNGVAAVSLFLVGYVLSPTILFWGWTRWVRRPKQRSIPAVLSLLGFVLATASALLAVSAATYSFVIGGFPYYDPLLMKIMGVGDLLSLGGLLFALSGIWQTSTLRWHAPVSAIATFAFWLAAAAGE